MPRTVLVTGAFGNIGSLVVRHLLGSGHRVVAMDLQTPRSEKAAAAFGNGLTVVWGNICDPSLWARALDGVDVVIHMAAIIPPNVDRNPKLAIAVNQTATAELIRRMEESSTAKRLVFASSMVVSGQDQSGRIPPLRVEEPTKATDLYGETKVECEKLIRSSSLRWSILRISGCPPMNLSFKDIDNLPAIFETSPDGRIEVVHADDAALAFANAVDCDAAVGKILFIGGGKSCQSYALEFYNRVFSAMGLRKINPKILRPGPPRFYGDWLDTEESQKLLQYQRHSIKQLVDELRRNVGFRWWLLKAVSPIVSVLLAQRSPYPKQAASRQTS